MGNRVRALPRGSASHRHWATFESRILQMNNERQLSIFWVCGEWPLSIFATGSNGHLCDRQLSKLIAVKQPVNFRFPKTAFR
jgi:hypothetical protein